MGKYVKAFVRFMNENISYNIILYHGTSSENSKNIGKEGFREVSYFTTNWEDAEY